MTKADRKEQRRRHAPCSELHHARRSGCGGKQHGGEDALRVARGGCDAAPAGVHTRVKVRDSDHLRRQDARHAGGRGWEARVRKQRAFAAADGVVVIAVGVDAIQRAETARVATLLRLDRRSDSTRAGRSPQRASADADVIVAVNVVERAAHDGRAALRLRKALLLQDLHIGATTERHGLLIDASERARRARRRAAAVHAAGVAGGAGRLLVWVMNAQKHLVNAVRLLHTRLVHAAKHATQRRYFTRLVLDLLELAAALAGEERSFCAGPKLGAGHAAIHVRLPRAVDVDSATDDALGRAGAQAGVVRADADAKGAEAMSRQVRRDLKRTPAAAAPGAGRPRSRVTCSARTRCRWCCWRPFF